MLEEHRKSGPRTKAKGKWLEQTIAETMVSMSEDLYDTEDDEAPFNIKNLLRRPSRESKVRSICTAPCATINLWPCAWTWQKLLPQLPAARRSLHTA